MKYTDDQQSLYDKLTKLKKGFVDALLRGASPEKAYILSKKKLKQKPAKDTVVSGVNILKHHVVDDLLKLVAPSLRYEPTETGAAHKGNQDWRLRINHGRKFMFNKPEELWEKACKYFDYIEENPLYETKSYSFKGKPHHDAIPKMRAMTIDGFQLFVGMTQTTWYNYKEKDDFRDTIEMIEKVIRSQKFEGAAADLLNSAIIVRDLGLKDSSEISGPDGGAIKTQSSVITSEMKPEEAAEIYKDLMK